MNKKSEKDKAVLIRSDIHRSLKMLTVSHNVKIHDLVNELLSIVMSDRQKVEEIIMELESA